MHYFNESLTCVNLALALIFLRGTSNGIGHN